MKLKERLAAVSAEAQEIITLAEKGHPLTEADTKRLNDLREEATGLRARIEAVEGAGDFFKSLGNPAAGAQEQEKQIGVPAAKSLGEIAVKNFTETGVLTNISEHRKANSDFMFKQGEGPVVSGPGKTVTTTNVVGTASSLLLPDIDKDIVKQHLQRPTIANWLGSGTITGNAITYFLEKAWENSTHGSPAMVGQNEKKSGVTPPDYEQKTVHLKKLAGWLSLTDEMAEDADFLVSEINNRLLVQLALAEEAQLLNGTGSGNQIEGLLTNSGLLTETSAKAEDNLDAIYRAQNQVFLATGLKVDGLVINPADYQKLRLTKDSNGQYFAGGPFTGPYGVGGVLTDPPVWGINVIQTTAIPAGTALVGAGKQAATVYRKGSLRVEVSNNVNDDFLYNRFVVLAEERLALATRMPKGFAKVSLK